MKAYNVFVADVTGGVPEVESRSVDVIITDPLYGKDFLYLWEALAKLAKRVLKPGGQLYAMSGTKYAREVMNILSEHLKYRCLISDYMSMKGGVYLNRACHTIQHWKPVMWYQNGGKLGKYLGDIIYSDRVPNNKMHEYQQNLLAFENMVKTHTEKGDLVYDPFVGSGTTGVACIKYGRKFIGSDIDPKNVRISEKRLSAVTPAVRIKIDKLVLKRNEKRR